MSLPAPIPSLFDERWRSKQHVGPAKPTAIVQIQRGIMDRAFQEFEMLDGSKPEFGYISLGKNRLHPWQAFWRSTGSWITLPNVLSIDTEDSFDGDGVGEPTVANVVVENIGYIDATGPGGPYTRIVRGYYAPFFGFRAVGRPTDEDAEENEWLDRLYGGYRVRVLQGYGNSRVETFIGLIDDTDISASPDEITLTCRSFGKMLTDQEVFGWNKAADIGSPITFADRLKADDVEKVGKAALASSTQPGFPASNVLKPGDSQYWTSLEHHTTPGNTEWVQIRVPKGRYETFYINPGYDGMEVYLSVYAHSKGLGHAEIDPETGGTSQVGTKVKVDRVEVEDGWIDKHGGDLVPGTEGGIPYVRKWNSMDKGGKSLDLGIRLECGDDTIIRISFRKLHRVKANDYRAKCFRLCAFKRKRSADARTEHWILVDDAADVVRWVLMWAGFKEWDIDDFGVRLAKPLTFHQGDHLIDIIRHMVKLANVVFFIDRPSSHADSIGVPRLKRVNAVGPRSDAATIEVRDTDLLTSLKTKFTKEVLAFIIRTRGRATTKADKKKKIKGTTLGEDKTARIQAVYHPPWSGARPDFEGPFAAGRVSGVYKHVTHNDPFIDTVDEAAMSNILIAIQEALAAYTGDCRIPGYPVSLNQQVSVIDTPSGTNSRLWLSRHSSTFRQGEDAEYFTTVAGAVVDWPDLNQISEDYDALLAKVVAENAI